MDVDIDLTFVVIYSHICFSTTKFVTYITVFTRFFHLQVIIPLPTY